MQKTTAVGTATTQEEKGPNLTTGHGAYDEEEDP